LHFKALPCQALDIIPLASQFINEPQPLVLQRSNGWDISREAKPAALGKVDLTYYPMFPGMNPVISGAEHCEVFGVNSSRDSFALTSEVQNPYISSRAIAHQKSVSVWGSSRQQKELHLDLTRE